MKIRPSQKMFIALVVIAGIITFVYFWGSGASNMASAGMQSQGVEVRVTQVIKSDAPITYDFVGQVVSQNEVKIIAKVSGNIVARMVNGGDNISRGQALFRIDNKQYLSVINSAQANLAKSRATLTNTLRDVDRYRKLAAAGGIAQQTLDSYLSQAQEDAAQVAANQASLEQARQDEADTLIVSPVNGRIGTDALSVGDFATGGSTVLAKVSSLDPVWVQFSMSEDEYIKLARLGKGTLPDYLKSNLKLILSDGSEYGITGHIEQLDKGISDTTGSITLKAGFANPQHFLIPGMFAKVRACGEVKHGVLIIPKRAVKDILDGTFVSVVTADGKAESRLVILGEDVGNLCIVESGLKAGERVIVEGGDKVKPGDAVRVKLVKTDLSPLQE
jgi:membrane fusion protein, multidrug efflux system